MDVDAEADADALLEDALARCGDEQRLLSSLAGEWEPSAEGLVNAAIQWLQAPASGSFRDEALARLCAGLLVDLAAHPLCGSERVLSRMPAACPPRLWDALCQVVAATAADEHLSDRRRAEFFSRILFAVNALPRQMTPQVTRRARRGVVALTALLDSSPRGARFVLLSGSVLPPGGGGGGGGSGSGSGGERADSHWMLAPVILRAAHRRRKLRNALRAPSLRAVGCTEHLLGLAVDAPPLPADEYLALTPHAAEHRHRLAVAGVREFLRHNVEQDWIKHTLCAGLVKSTPGLGKDGVSKVLEAAIAAEIEDALCLCNGNLAADAEGRCFDRWIQLSDLLYACARDGLISLEAVLTTISEGQNDDLGSTALGMVGPDSSSQLFTGGRATVWLLAQCSTEALRDALSKDSRAAAPSLLPAFLHSFGEPRSYLLSSAGGGGAAVWDWLPEAGLFSILFRAPELYKLKERAAAQDYGVASEAAMRVYPKVKDTCFELAKRSLEREAQCHHIWSISTTPIPSVVTAVLGDERAVGGSAGVACFATLSHMMATQISTKLFRLLGSPELEPILAAVPIRPGGQTRSPHRQVPLPLRILSALSVPCRYKLRDQLDSALTGKAVGSGVWETYARLLFLSPRSCFHCEMVKDVRGIVTVLASAPFVNVLELVELRLLRLLARLVSRGAGAIGGANREGSASTFVLWLWRHYTTLAGKMSVSNNPGLPAGSPPTSADPMDSLRLSVYVEIQEVLLALLTAFPQLLLVGKELTSSSASVRGWNPFLPRVGVRATLAALRSDARGSKQQAGLVESLSRLSEATASSAAGGHTAQLKAMHSTVHTGLATALSPGKEGGSGEPAVKLTGEQQVYYAVNSMKLRAAVVETEHQPGADLVLIALLRMNRVTKPGTKLSPPPADGSAIVAGRTAMTPDEHLSLEMVLCLSWYLYAVQVPAQLQTDYIHVESIRCVVAGLGGRALLEAAPAVLNYIIASTPPRPTDVSDEGAWTARAQSNMALSKWVWEWKLLPLSAVVLYLAEVLSAGQPQTADAAHHHLDYLLVKDKNLTERLDWLVESGPSPFWWREDDDMRKESEFRAKFPPPIGSAMSSMTECERLLPTLDIVLGCLIEATEGESDAKIRHNLRSTLSTLISSVVPKIYPFHATGVGFLVRFISMYYNCPVLNAPLKDALVKGVLGRGTGPGTSTGDSGSALEFFCPDLCAPSGVDGASPRAQRARARTATTAGTVEHLTAALERAATVWRQQPGSASAEAPDGNGGEPGDAGAGAPVPSWPRWDDLTFGEFPSAAEAAAFIPRLEFLRAAAPWECAAPGEPPLPSPAKKMVAQPRTAAEEGFGTAEASSVVLGNLVAAAVGQQQNGGAGRTRTAAVDANAGARVALAAMVLERVPVEMQGEIPAHVAVYLHGTISNQQEAEQAEEAAAAAAAEGRRLRARLVRLVQSYLESETGRELSTLKHFGATLTKLSPPDADGLAGGDDDGARARTRSRSLLHLHFAVAALAPSISSCLLNGVILAGGRGARDEQIATAGELLCGVLGLVKELPPESEWQGGAAAGLAGERKVLEVRLVLSCLIVSCLLSSAASK
jgi:hypothetical protein